MHIRQFLALLLALPAAAQHICLAEGSSTSLRIATVTEANPNGGDTVVLQNVELLPIEITGRTIAREFDASRSRRTARHGIVRVELPDGGRLFRYRRNGGQQWGYLHVGAVGQATVVLELPGVGGTVDPFVDRVAVADDGRHAAIAVAAGGVYAVKLDGTLYASTGRSDRLAAPPTHLAEPAGTMVGPTHFFYVTGAHRIYRCSLVDGAAPVDLTPAALPGDRLKDQLAMSGDGQHVVFLHGPQHNMQLWRASVVGGANLLPPPPGKYEEPDYLPEGAGAPSMLLNADGSRLFYVDAQVRDELYLLDTSGTLPMLQITQDPIFQPYIGVYILPKFRAHTLLIAIGDPAQMDWFHASLGLVGGSVTNLTGTGSMQQPFPSGTLSPAAGADAGASVLLLEQVAGGMNLRRMDPLTGSSAIVQADATLTFEVGSGFGTGVDTVVRGNAGERLYRGAVATPFATTPAGVSMTVPVHGPWFAATRLHLQQPWSVPAYYFPDGLVVPGLIEFGLDQIVLTAAGGIVLNGTTLRFVDFGGSVTLQRPPAARRLVLSGAGG